MNKKPDQSDAAATGLPVTITAPLVPPAGKLLAPGDPAFLVHPDQMDEVTLTEYQRLTHLARIAGEDGVFPNGKTGKQLREEYERHCLEADTASRKEATNNGSNATLNNSSTK